MEEDVEISDESSIDNKSENKEESAILNIVNELNICIELCQRFIKNLEIEDTNSLEFQSVDKKESENVNTLDEITICKDVITQKSNNESESLIANQENENNFLLNINPEDFQNVVKEKTAPLNIQNVITICKDEKNESLKANQENDLSDINSDDISKKSLTMCTVILLITILFGGLDICSDLWLMINYFIDSKFLYGCLTLLFIWYPSFMNTWLFYEIYRLSLFEKSWMRIFVKRKWLLIFIFLFQASSILVAIHNLYFLIYKEKKKNIHKQRNEFLLLMQMYDSFVEAAPQLTLQTFIVLNNIDQSIHDTSALNMIRWISMILSLFTIARVAFSRQRSFYIIENISLKLELKEKLANFIQIFFMIVSRIIIISMGFVCVPLITIIYLVIRCIVTIIYHVKIMQFNVNSKPWNILSCIHSEGIFHIYHVNRSYYPFLQLDDINKYYYVFQYELYVFECMMFTVIWMLKIDSVHFGVIMCYVIPSIEVTLLVLNIVFVIITNYIAKNRKGVAIIRKS